MADARKNDTFGQQRGPRVIDFRSRGVALLDTYIDETYQPSETFGFLSIWQRR